MTPTPEQDRTRKAARYLPEWEAGELPSAPVFRLGSVRTLIGPGLLMVGATIGGGEWMFGPIVTARYGGIVMWIAALSILFQVVFNLSVMRYALYSGEPIFVGFLRTAPGPKFWIFLYLIADSGYIWPYAASNAAVPVAAAWLGRLPGPADDFLVRTLGYAIFLGCFVPLIFGGKVYNSVEKIMTAKVIYVFVFLLGVDLFLVSGETWLEVFSGFLKVGVLPEGDVNWAMLAAFAAVAGVGGLSNTLFSNYARDKGWGMGALVGAIPSLVGGKKVALSHVGKVFAITPASLKRWKGWLTYINRDQIWIWGFGSLVGMALPAMLSLEFLRGVEVEGHAAAAMTARGIADQHGEIFWYLTLICGFIVLGVGNIHAGRQPSTASCAAGRMCSGAPRATCARKASGSRTSTTSSCSRTACGGCWLCGSRRIRSSWRSSVASAGTSGWGLRPSTRWSSTADSCRLSCGSPGISSLDS